MKIGLIGAPGSGKTQLAEALQARLGLTVIDHYVEDVEDHLNYKLGRFATYVGNLAVMIERHARENAAGDNYVSCGTPIDTVTYMAAAAHIQKGAGEHWIRRGVASLSVAGCMVDDLWDYDHAFLLESTPQDSWEAALAHELFTAVDVFEREYVPLVPGPVEQLVKDVKSHIKFVERHQ